MKRLIQKIILFVLPIAFFAFGSLVFSETANAQGLNLGLQSAAQTGLATTDIRIIIANIIRVALGLLGIGAVGLMMYAGYEYMTAGGNEEQIGTAKKIMVNAAIGLAIILSAYSIVSFVMSKLLEATGPGVPAHCADGAQNFDESGLDCGGSCNACACVGAECYPAGTFYVVSLPTQHQTCISNVHPIVEFSKPIDVDSLDGNLIIHKIEEVGGTGEYLGVAGTWSSTEADPNIAIFTPSGACSDGGNDCFATSTDYILNFKNSVNIKTTADNSASLNCTYGAGCGDTAFFTGDGPDRIPPHISISNINQGDIFEQGILKGVYVAYSDDHGVQNISLKVDGQTIGVANFNGCNSSGSATINWNTSPFALGNHTVQARGLDFAAQASSSILYNINLVPAHCLDNQQNSDETGIDCGGAGCKQCDGGKCTTDADCSGGRYCQKTTATSTDGFCLEKMFISNISPLSAAHGDYLSITGKFFGNAPGHVYFKNGSGADTEASMANCGSGFDSWIPNQLIVVVPNDAVSSSIKVVTASTTGPDNVVRQFVDYTGAAGWKYHAPDFVLSSTTHPGVCGVNPTSGQMGSSVTVTGKNFGTSKGSNDFLKFFETKAVIDSWSSDTSVTGKVPLTLANDEYAVKITKNGIDSNGVLFNIFGSVANGPIVSGLSATSGVFSDYLTIYGSNFGNTQYKVWFSKIDNIGNEIPNSAVFGSTDFPSVCQKISTWSDKQIVVKIPVLDSGSLYAVRVERPDFSDQSVLLKSPFDTAMSVKIFDGAASPGICGITPAVGPVPSLVTLAGEHFSASSKVYFSKINSDPDVISSFASSSVGSLVNYSDGGQKITATSTADTASGQIFVIDNNKQSNNVLFKVYNCLNNGNTCPGTGLKCCATGADAGSCSATCSDDKKSTGYMWVFSTNKIQPLPHVVERCGDQTEFGANKLLPSPSPAIMWNGNGHFDANSVCQTAFATVEFNSQMKQSTINSNTVKVYSCGGGNFNIANCTTTVDVDIKPLLPANGSGQHIQLYPANTTGHRWDPNMWYQVRLMNGITSDGATATTSLPLAITKSCGDGTAYCFNFKTKEGDCKLRSVVITPSSFWTTIIDEVQPIKVRSFNMDPYDLIYQGNGLSNQYCTLMNVGGLPWTWSSASTTLAGVTSTAGLENNQTKALAFKNTVGVGIFGDFVNIHASVGTSGTGTCADDGVTACAVDDDCKYTIYKVLTKQIKKKLSDPSKFCVLNYTSSFPTSAYFFDLSLTEPNQALKCNVPSDCTNNTNFNVWSSTISGTNKVAVCNSIAAAASSSTVHNSTCNLPAFKTGDSPLTIDLTHPEVAGYGPNCLEACTNATVYAKFNTTMSDHNLFALSPAVVISKCNNENCTSLTRVTSTAVGLDNNDKTIINIFGKGATDLLETNSLYLVQLSTTSPAGTDIGDQVWTGGSGAMPIKPYNKTFSWRFRTKAVACAPSRIDVTPVVFTAQKLDDRAVFKADVYSAKDACSVNGQKLNPWTESWTWDSTDKNVATIQTFNTIGSNPFCTNNCVKKGSTIAAVTGTPIYAVCGNNKIEAGEDCDPPVSSTCKLSCLSVNKTNKGSKPVTESLDVNASICGNGLLGAGEDCDLGITPNISSPTSSLLCSANCLHQGTRLSVAWCANPASTTASGYNDSDRKKYCSQAYSQCGDGVWSPDEDLRSDGTPCDLGNGNYDSTQCNNRCLRLQRCTPGSIGCSVEGQLLGSSLTYTSSTGTAAPSVCGDGVPGFGEDYSCDHDLQSYMLYNHPFTDPWVLAIGKGMGSATVGVPPVLSTDITAHVSSTNVGGVGKYQVKCGYKNDSECAKYGSDYAVSDNSCCVLRPKVTSVYPGSTSTVPVPNICINTQISVAFDKIIDEKTLAGNFLIARGIASGNCASGTEDVTASTLLTHVDQNLPWYQKIWHQVVAFVKNILGSDAKAGTVSKWCAGLDKGNAQVVYTGNGTSMIQVDLKSALAPLTDYAIILKDGIKDVHGVSIQQGAGNKAFSWHYITNDQICEISGVNVSPNQYYFSRPNATTTLVATGMTGNNQQIQPVTGYSWEYIWGPVSNSFVTIATSSDSTATITSLNRNGELDVYATANITQNIFTKQVGAVATGKSHIIVFLCENPWPPKPYSIHNEQHDWTIFPYEDKYGNNDGFDLTTSVFNNTYILPSDVYKGGYFNFATYYCADNGNIGVADDLPYLYPAVQVSSAILGSGLFVTSSYNVTTTVIVTTTIVTTSTVPATSTCANNPLQDCAQDADCGVAKIVKNNGTATFAASSTKSGICCATFIGSGSNFYCLRQSAPLFSSGVSFSCDNSTDCSNSIIPSGNYGNWLATLPGYVLYASNSTLTCHKLYNLPNTPISTCQQNTKIVTSTIITTTTQNIGSIAIQSQATPLKALKRFIFTNNKNSDAVGIQIFDNPTHLSPREWFKSQQFFGNPLDKSIDNYPGVTDGDNIYVSALNFVPTKYSVPNTGSISEDIYLFSISKNAQPETRKVFEELIKNMSFNANLTNYGYCGPNVTTVDATNQVACKNDFDCPITSVCAVQKDKLRRDFLRLSDMRTIEQALAIASSSNGGKYPDLKSGSYLTGQTLSTWPSWTTLGSLVGGLLPTDPVNKLGTAGTCAVSTTVFCTTDANCETPVTSSSQKCLLHDPVTGWSTVDRRFSFACAPNSLAYRYIATSTANYKVRFSMEDIGLQLEPQNVQDIFSFFIDDLTHFNAEDYLNDTQNNTGICNQDQEISTVSQGKCGDGQINLNLGEECDPQGKVDYDLSSCTVAGATSSTPLMGKVCNADCHWGASTQLSTCGQKYGKCGNGLIELSETCDDGALNGKYNHCNKTCDGFTALCGDGQVTSTFEYCDIASTVYYNNFNNDTWYQTTSTGWCVGGIDDNSGCINNSSCNNYYDNGQFGHYTSSNGKCVTLDNNKNRYSLVKQNACSFDCQKVGPYCGDGHVDTVFGEECDGNGNGDGKGEISCTINNQSAVRKCNAKCRWENASAVAYYNFNDVFVYAGNSHEKNYASSPNFVGDAFCGTASGVSCPFPDASGVLGQAMMFNGSSTYFKAFNADGYNLNELTISAWIKVNSTTSDGWHPIVAKQNGLSATVDERDYNFYVFVTSSKVTNLYFASQQATNVRILGDAWALDPSNTNSIFATDQWNFVAITVDANRKGKFYTYNTNLQTMSQLGNTFSNGSSTLQADRDYPIFIGAADFYFKGSIDELQVYDRALSLDEIKDLRDHTNNFCQLKTITPTAPTTEIACGDGKADTGEECDNGSQNGVACTATYGKGCWYCSYKTCKRINVSPLGYCGDGVVNGPEACDVESGGQIYSAATTTGTNSSGLGTSANKIGTNGYAVSQCNYEYNTKLNLDSLSLFTDHFDDKAFLFNNLSFKVGTKTCSADCKTLNYKTCVECGLSSNGIKVGGGLINVLHPTSNNPLIFESSAIAPGGHWGTIGLASMLDNEVYFNNTNNVAYKFFETGNGGNNYNFNPVPDSDVNDTIVASINPDPMCSDPTQDRNYYLQLNADLALAHRIYYPISADKPADQYNLLLSPVIQNNNNAASRPRDIRIVVSWENYIGTPVVGQNTFAAGFLVPSGLPNTTYEGAALTNSIGFNDYSNSSTPFYLTVSSSPFGNIWYHNLGGVKNLYEESFTINTENLAASSYAFYVRSTTSTTMINYNNIAKLKVDVYMPEQKDPLENNDVYRHFSQPVKTYYLDNNTYYADANSTNAKYWHVFNILSTNSSQTATLSTAIEDNPRYYNRTVSQSTLNMTYTDKPNPKYP